jgi:hypothetical protein
LHNCADPSTPARLSTLARYPCRLTRGLTLRARICKQDAWRTRSAHIPEASSPYSSFVLRLLPSSSKSPPCAT